MSRATSSVEDVQVVGQHTHIEQSARQLREYLDIVVHAAQEY
jgi:hypothetical protein